MKHLKLFIFGAFALLSTVTLRTIQLVFLTDYKTGFYKEGMEGLGAGLMALLIAIIAVAGALIFVFDAQKLSPKPSSTLLGSAMLFAGLANIAEPFLSGTSLSALPVMFLGVRILLILAAGGCLCYLGVSMLLGKEIKAKLTVVLIVSWVVRLMTSFICFSKMSNISENLYDVLMLVFTLVFLLLLGKAVCGVRESKTHKTLFAVGIGAVLFSAVSAFPYIIASFTSKTLIAHTPLDSHVTSIFMAFFIAVYLVEICRTEAKNEG